ncbi:MAG: A/G-specific adenine glycosylase [Bryobacteraceae bacterium]
MATPCPAQIASIRRALMDWYRRAARELPWRRDRDPYRVWVAEIMLQQTRVAAVLPYYERFLALFPDVNALAAASLERVLAAWAGLGYYRRARSLLEAARRIAREGTFPKNYQGWRSLPGVGDYTAAAIASVVLGEPRAVLDGNVVRVLSRLAAESAPIELSATRARLAALAGRLLDPEDPGSFNQALMELGATVCLPRGPSCGSCPLANWCAARRQGIERELPHRRPRPARSPIHRTLLWIERDGRLLVCPCRGGRLEGFWELPGPEVAPCARIGETLAEFRHSITRYDSRIKVALAKVKATPCGCRWIELGGVQHLPLSTVTRKALAAVRRTRRGSGCASPQ